ncbi:hypothetical protein [Bacillus phage SPO1L1]|nr:hypothetical protein [Bacillus phage SPO1L1]WIT26148.1 hypothetical protein [Bacillus phage SPO1L2]
MTKFGVLYNDGGDQELRVGSIRKSVLFKWMEGGTIDLEECVTDPYAQIEFLTSGTKTSFEERYGDYPHVKFQPVTEFGTDATVVSQVVVIANELQDEQLLSRPELVDGGADDLVRGFQLSEGAEGGSTLVLVGNPRPECAAHAYLMDGDFSSTLSKLRGLELASVASYACYLDANATKVESWCYDSFNGGYVPEC